MASNNPRSILFVNIRAWVRVFCGMRKVVNG